MLKGPAAQTAVADGTMTRVTVMVPAGCRAVVITDDDVIMSKDQLMELRASSLGVADLVEKTVGHNPRTSQLRRLVKMLRGT